MATLREIRRRIRSVTNTQQITRAMKMVAAAKLRRAQRNLMALRPYAKSLDHLRLEAARRFIGDEHPLLRPREERRVGLLLLTSDKGLCGSYNNNLVRAAEDHMRHRPELDFTVSVVGSKGAHMLRRDGVTVADEWIELEDPADFRQVLGMAELFVERFENAEIDALDVIHAYFQSPLAQPTQTIRLLPLAPLTEEELDRPGNRPAEAADEAEVGEEDEIVEPYLFEPDDESLAKAILLRNVAVQLFRTVSESQTSEHGARMTAMENATENAEEMMDELTHTYNVARQQHITGELLDIVGGANALEKNGQ